ncbi:DUF2103 domain-containing protein [Vacuolonema iberomarrocanum]|uniref:DUF2103 domain-containing protein n=1 Tax=Vacuolonema iberomarrocanum TaxID=3454632 RepID=UPI0019FF0927|nr:metal-binding protein [filamentous cyanobacterium LEGE 07170]
MANERTGRVVWNHSTHIPGLIPVLERLAKLPHIGTVTPAVIGRAKGNTQVLKIKVSVPTRGGFKLIARKGKSFQEVFVITDLSKPELEAAIAQVLKS